MAHLVHKVGWNTERCTFCKNARQKGTEKSCRETDLGCGLPGKEDHVLSPEGELRGAESEWEVNSELSPEALGLEALTDKETEGLP